MKSPRCHHPFVGMSLAVLSVCFPEPARADFKGSDSLGTPNGDWWYDYSGGGAFASQNGRLEFILDAPTSADGAGLEWLANQGTSTQNWYLQVNTYLSHLPITPDGHVNVSLTVGNTGDVFSNQVVRISQYRFYDGPDYISSIVGYTDQGFYGDKESTAKSVTLRLHFDSKDRTITGSWNAGTGWKYLPPQSIARWGMTKADKFYAAIFAGSFAPAAVSYAIGPSTVYFSNFKAGTAQPDIAIGEKNRSLTDGVTKLNFGSVSAGSGAVTKTFTVFNGGTATLEGLKITCNGANPADFSFSKPSKTSLRPGSSTSFRVTFKPKTKAARKAVIHVASNDPDEASFDIPVYGAGVK